jgi:hypothetical protein
MDILKRLELLANQCAVSQHDCLVRAGKLQEQADSLELHSELYDDPEMLESAKAIMRDERKKLLDQASKEEQEARLWATRASYASRGMLLLGPDELSGRDVYPPDLHAAAIDAGVAYITPDRVGPLGESEADDAV